MHVGLFSFNFDVHFSLVEKDFLILTFMSQGMGS